MEITEVFAPYKDEKRWIAWYKDKRDNGTLTKPPVCVKPWNTDGLYRHASTNKESTWHTLRDAVETFSKPDITMHTDGGQKTVRLEGIGIMLGGGLTGIDLDHCRNPKTGDVSPEAKEIVERFSSYTEISPGGDGLHIFVDAGANVPLEDSKGQCKADLPDYEGHAQKVECRIKNCSLSVTGNVYGDVKPIAKGKDARKCVEWLRDKYSPPKTAPEPPPQSREYASALRAQSAPTGPARDKYGCMHYYPGMSDADRLEWMFGWGNGDKIRRLYEGDYSAYGNDTSAADFALCRHLAFATRYDPDSDRYAIVYRMFADSPLKQVTKAAKRWGKEGDAYAKNTINRALAQSPAELYVAYTPQPRPTPDEDFNVISDSELASIEASAPAGKQFSSVSSNKQEAKDLPVQIELIRADVYGVTRYEQDVLNMQGTSDRRTGWEYLDNYTERREVGGNDEDIPRQRSFYPGLYVIGGGTGIGKTTFALQLADYLAEQGEHVLYYSLEQGAFDLYSKSIARTLYSMARKSRDRCLMYARDPQDVATATELKTGRSDIAVAAAMDTYNGTHSTMHLAACDYGVTAEGIDLSARAYAANINRTGGDLAPITIVVDYLQGLTKENPRDTDRAAVDASIKRLKTMQRDMTDSGIPTTVLLLTSFNRDNYNKRAGLESIKESGGVEYTADVVWALQFTEIYKGGFNGLGEGQIREYLEILTHEPVRNITLSCHKNRFGSPGYHAHFQYNAAHDYFESLLRDLLDVPSCSRVWQMIREARAERAKA